MRAERPNEAAATGDFEFAALREARNYRAGLIREFAPALRGRVVEVGAGIGQMTELLGALPAVRELVSIEPDPRFCGGFRAAHPQRRLIEGTAADLADASGWDAVLSINVLEHIREDEAELARYASLLRSARGCLCLFVPAGPEIYAPIDCDFGHHRRYTRPELRAKLERTGFEVVRLHYFNGPGYFLWWLNFCVLKRRRFDVSSVRAYDRGVFPWVSWIESRLFRPPLGQSLMAVGRARG